MNSYSSRYKILIVLPNYIIVFSYIKLLPEELSYLHNKSLIIEGFKIDKLTTIDNKFKMPKFKSFMKKKNKSKDKNDHSLTIDQENGIRKCLLNNDAKSLDLMEKNLENNLNLLENHHSSDNNDNVEQENKQKDDKTDYMLPEEQCDIPSFKNTKNSSPELIDETRLLLKERYAKNPDSFYDEDYKRMLTDDWTVTRFLLRRREDPKRTAKLMEECGRFRKEYKMSEVQLWEFPIEFHKAGGLFKYAHDRVGNTTVYMRVKMYRRVPEISDVFKAFILCVIELADKENDGRGFAVIFDLSGCGLKNVDLAFLSWLLSAFRNYCPKGCSYILVYNLPWILNATCKLAMSWMSATNRRALRFVHGKEIENFIAPENLPDYCGGKCKIDYRQVPKGSKRAVDVCEQLDITKKQANKIKELFKEYLSDDDDDDDEYDNEENEDNDNGNGNDIEKDSDDITFAHNGDYEHGNEDEDDDDDDEYCTDEDDDDDYDDNHNQTTTTTTVLTSNGR